MQENDTAFYSSAPLRSSNERRDGTERVFNVNHIGGSGICVSYANLLLVDAIASIRDSENMCILMVEQNDLLDDPAMRKLYLGAEIETGA